MNGRLARLENRAWIAAGELTFAGQLSGCTAVGAAKWASAGRFAHELPFSPAATIALGILSVALFAHGGHQAAIQIPEQAFELGEVAATAPHIPLPDGPPILRSVPNQPDNPE